MLPYIIIIFLVVIDQVVKIVCVEKLVDTVTIIPGFIELMYLENTGAAFGIMKGNRLFLIVLPILIIIGLIYFFSKLKDSKADKYTRYSLILIIAGAIGNLIDRVLNGYVVDMFHFTFFNFPVFNVADIYVVIGTISLVLVTKIFDEDEKDAEN